MRFHALAIGITLCIGCNRPDPAAPKAVAVPPPKMEKKDDANTPLVKDARADTDAILKDLLAGKAGEDSMLARLADKLKGFTSWSIETQEIVAGEPPTVRFGGTLTRPGGEATFRVSMTKQKSGKWMIGTFQGPNPK